MVGWYDPGVLLRTAVRVAISTIFGQNADARLLEVFSFGGGTEKAYDYTGTVPAQPDGQPGNEFWLDFVADTGDGWNSSYAMAYHLARPVLRLGLKGSKDLHDTPRGRLLVIGGDLVYPTPSVRSYKEYFHKVYQTAFPPGSTPDAERPDVFAIPGNHDWYDSLVAFTRLFVADNKLAGWGAPQDRSYFALQLPFGWWLLGVDLQLAMPIDKPQIDFFDDVAAEIKPEHGVIVCVHEPLWIYKKLDSDRGDSDLAEENLTFFESRVLKRKVDVFIAGDIHYYRRHADAAGNQKIVAGGGGAFLHATHMPDVSTLPAEVDPDEVSRAAAKGTGHDYTEQCCYPDKAQSRRLSWLNLFFPFQNWWFGVLPALGYFMAMWATHTEEKPTSLADLVEKRVLTIVADHTAVYWLLALFLAFWFFTDVRSKWFRYIMGTAHGLTHVGAALVVCWLSIEFLVDVRHVGYGTPEQLLLTGLTNFIGGWFVGSFIMGVYLLISLNWFGKHWNEAFSALHIADFKNFLRLKFASNGDLTIYPIAVERVPKKWRDATPADRAAGIASGLIPVDGAEPMLIEQPIVVKRAAAPPVPPAAGGAGT